MALRRLSQQLLWHGPFGTLSLRVPCLRRPDCLLVVPLTAGLSDLVSLRRPPSSLKRPEEGQVIPTSADVVTVEPLAFSAYLRKKLPPIRIKKLEKEWTVSQEPFYAQLSSVQDVEELFEIVERNGEEMDTEALTQFIETAFYCVRNDNKGNEAWNSVGMQKLMKLIRRKVRHFMAGDCVRALKLLIVLGVPGSDVNLQMLLKILIKQANSLSVSELVYLDFLLRKLGKENQTPLSTALAMTLPIVFQSQVSSQAGTGELKVEKVEEVCRYLHYATDRRMPERVIRELVSTLEPNILSVTPHNALSILWSLSNDRYSGSYQELVVSHCFSVLTENMDSFELDSLSTTLEKATKQFVIRNLVFFNNEDFLHAFCNRLMRRQNRGQSQQHVLFCFRQISRMKHIHVEYMDRLGEIIAGDPSLVLNDDLMYASLVRSFASCNYKPENWAKFEALLLNHPALSKELTAVEIYLALDFLELDTFPEQLIARIFSPQNYPVMEAFMERNPENASRVLLLIISAVHALYPDYAGPLPPQSMIQKWREMGNQRKRTKDTANLALKDALTTSFGGESYVIDGLSHNGLFIDYAIVLRKGGYPVAVNVDSRTIEDLNQIQKPSESDIVMLKVFWRESYASNTFRLLGIAALEQRILERLSPSVVFLDGVRWARLPDYEKIPYVMHRLRDKIGKFEYNQSKM